MPSWSDYPNAEQRPTQPSATVQSANDILTQHLRDLEAAQKTRMQTGDFSAWPYNTAFPEASQYPEPPQAHDDGSADDLLDAARLSDLHERLRYASLHAASPQTLRGIMSGLTRVIESLEARARQNISRSHQLREGIALSPDWAKPVEESLRRQGAWGYSDTSAQTPRQYIDGQGKHKTCKWEENRQTGQHTITLTGEGTSATEALVNVGDAWMRLETWLTDLGYVERMREEGAGASTGVDDPFMGTIQGSDTSGHPEYGSSDGPGD